MTRREVRLPAGVEFLLGGIPDQRLGELSGIGGQVIRYHRLKMGIPAVGYSTSVSKLPEGVEMWLGAVNDKELAELSGFSLMQIGYARRRAGIPISGVNRGWRRKDAAENWKRGEEICEVVLRENDHVTAARLFKLTRERVRQICNKHGLRRIWIRPQGETVSTGT